jgi:REP element-mobilizing transposase RayT
MHSSTCCHLHIVFATKERRPFLTPVIQSRLWAYLGGIARENKIKALAVGGVEDHVHMLISLPATLSIAKAVQLIKGNSSKWIHETFPELTQFEWQEGYAVFSIGVSGIDETVTYIRNQAEHHRRATFKEELAAFLKKHGMPYDEMVLGD